MIKTIKNGIAYPLEHEKIYINGTWHTVKGGDCLWYNGTWHYVGIPLIFSSSNNAITTSVKLTATDATLWDSVEIYYRSKYTGSDFWGEWTRFDQTTNEVHCAGWIQFINLKGNLSTSSGYFHFETNPYARISGNIMAMLNWSDECKPYCFRNLFLETRLNIIYGFHMPSTKLAEYCYSGMFSCSEITIPPDLPATKLAVGCYSDMFNSCYKLIRTPELPAKDLVPDCYLRMFRSCERVTSVCCHAEAWLDGATDYWLQGVSDTGLFGRSSSLPIEYGSHKIPFDWDVYLY